MPPPCNDKCRRSYNSTPRAEGPIHHSSFDTFKHIAMHQIDCRWRKGTGPFLRTYSSKAETVNKMDQSPLVRSHSPSALPYPRGSLVPMSLPSLSAAMACVRPAPV